MRYLSCIQIVALLIISFSAISQDSLIDREGNKYRILQIGEQTWMADNLSITHAPDGRPVECFNYMNDSQYGKKYGKLYSWTVAMNASDKVGCQGICPEGWHLPTDKEWTQLTDFLGGIDQAGKAMKGNENEGFIRCFGGNYFPEIQAFSFIDQQAYFWTSTAYTETSAWIRNIGAKTINANRTTVPKKYCFSVRCLKN
ncbi:MAG: fibrobacter succinogenes major paralogous domain-containing protein [Bacteroidetes bacterium]|nr:fibrobacter succinogenes major paralogous domain-containing protein [Bacteroidota bacterium]